MIVKIVNTQKQTIKILKGTETLHVYYAKKAKEKSEKGVLRIADKHFVRIPKHGYIAIEETGAKDPRSN